MIQTETRRVKNLFLPFLAHCRPGRQEKSLRAGNPSVSGIEEASEPVTQGFSPDLSLRARGPHGPAAALKG